MGKRIQRRGVRCGEMRHDQYGPYFFERPQVVGKLGGRTDTESQTGHARIELDGDGQRREPARQMALHQNPFKAFLIVHQRRDVVTRRQCRVFVARQPHQGKQKGRVPFLSEQCAFPYGPHRHMSDAFLRQHASHGDHTVPVRVGLDDRHKRRVPCQQGFKVVAQVFQMDGDQGAAQKHRGLHERMLPLEENGMRFGESRRGTEKLLISHLMEIAVEKAVVHPLFPPGGEAGGCARVFLFGKWARVHPHDSCTEFVFRRAVRARNAIAGGLLSKALPITGLC